VVDACHVVQEPGDLFAFPLELLLIAEVLVLAPATFSKEGTAGIDAIGAGREYFEEVGAGVALVVAIDAGPDLLSGEAKGDEDDPALTFWALGLFALGLGFVRFLFRQGDAGNAYP